MSMKQRNPETTADTAVGCKQFVNSKKNVTEAIDEFMLRFPAEKRPTVRMWFVELRMPNGERLIRLQEFLSEKGYVLSSVVVLPENVRFMRKLIAERRLSADDLQQRLGYAGSSWVFQVLFGKTEMTEPFREKFNSAVRDFRRKFAQTAPSTVAKAPVADPVVVPVANDAHNTNNANIEMLTQLIAAHALALAPLAELALSDALTAEDRAQIRAAAHGDGIFKLNNLLTRLCSERARQKLA